tara:strand:- start:20638 stop:21243 length:606 start_codon:yes stop_codon:yes gene_type:complete
LTHSQQNPIFKNEVISINKKYDSIWNPSLETIVFTGSSSVRMWKNLQDVFPNHQIINSGFGGSEAIDLLGYTHELILKFKPKKVFIYEGDNDLFAKKRPKDIISSLAAIITQIKNQNETTKIILISPKPSIVRWNLKSKYKRFNRKLQRFCKKNNDLEFANVWNIMLDKKKLKTELFIDDGLHMNDHGYQLWYSVIKNYMN